MPNKNEKDTRINTNPKIPFPKPELYDRESEGEAPLAGEKGRGIEKEAVPFTAFTENFSSMPFNAPPPLGKEMDGTSIALDFVLPPSVLKNGVEEFWSPDSLFILFL